MVKDLKGSGYVIFEEQAAWHAYATAPLRMM
jgi:hypothetical protein